MNNGIKYNLFLYYVKPVYRFFYLYIIRFGFIDGKIGFQLAKLSAYGVKQRYIELKKMIKN